MMLVVSSISSLDVWGSMQEIELASDDSFPELKLNLLSPRPDSKLPTFFSSISADSARRNYDFANGYNAEDPLPYTRPAVRYPPTASSSFSGRPSSSQLTAAEIRQRREAQDSRSRFADIPSLLSKCERSSHTKANFVLLLPLFDRPTSTQPTWPLAYRETLQPQSQPMYKPVQYSRSYSAASPSSRPSSSTPTLSAAEVRARREAHDNRGRAPRTFLPPLAHPYRLTPVNPIDMSSSSFLPILVLQPNHPSLVYRLLPLATST